VYSTQRAGALGTEAHFRESAKHKNGEPHPAEHVNIPNSQRPPVDKSSKRPGPAQKVDPTWFFPVGSKVVHQQLGKGVVLPPKSKESSEEMLVFIKFRNGEHREFPAHGSDLSPIVF
jgi:hypothetical protein